MFHVDEVGRKLTNDVVRRTESFVCISIPYNASGRTDNE